MIRVLRLASQFSCLQSIIMTQMCSTNFWCYFLWKVYGLMGIPSLCLPLRRLWKINPIKYIPALVDGDIVVSDSLAISLVSSKCCFSRFSFCNYVNVLFGMPLHAFVMSLTSYRIEQYLEDKYPEHPLLPKDLKRKALNLQVMSRSKSLVVSCSQK